VEEFWKAEEKRIDLNLEDEIVKGCVITHQGKIVNEMIAKHYSA
jgi:NAD(P) transhydrogenase subunit alpha